jgi:hypothetical protein
MGGAGASRGSRARGTARDEQRAKNGLMRGAVTLAQAWRKPLVQFLTSLFVVSTLVGLHASHRRSTTVLIDLAVLAAGCIFWGLLGLVVKRRQD